MFNKLLLAIVVGSAIGLAGCNGGGGGGGDDAPDNLVGKFIDAPVEGLVYVSNSTSGVTGADGSFDYVEGEMVEFFIGNLSIGEVLGYEYVTPYDLESDLNDDFGLNLLRLLQTLDTDADPYNGITLDPDLVGGEDVDLHVTLEAFEADSDTIAFVSANTNSNILVSIEDAASHFQSSITNLNSDYTLTLSGTEWVSVITLSYCQSGVQAGFNYTLGQQVSVSGTDEFSSSNYSFCTVGSSDSETYDYDLYPDSAIACGAVCDYNDLNRITYGTDDDGREFVTTVWHTPNSDIITYIKKVLSDPTDDDFVVHTFKEVMYRVYN